MARYASIVEEVRRWVGDTNALVAAVALRGRRIVEIGTNSENRTRFGRKTYTSVHAEMDLIRRLLRHFHAPFKFSVLIVRFGGKHSDARPCLFCCSHLRRCFSKVYCTDAHGNVIEADLSREYVSGAARTLLFGHT